MRSAALGMSLGGSTSTLGLGVLAQLSSLTSRCSSSRTLVRYSSSLSRSSVPRSDRSDFGLIADVVEDAAAVFEAAHLGLDFVGAAFEEQPGEHLRRRVVRRHDRPGAGPGQAEPFARQGQAGEARLAADVLGRELVERDRVAKAGPARARHAGQEAGRGLVGEPRTHPRMRQPGDDREIVAVVLEQFQVGRELVVLAGLLGKEIGGMQSQRRADADHAPRRLRRRRPTHGRRREGVEPGQGQRDAGGPEEASRSHGMFMAKSIGSSTRHLLALKHFALHDLVNQRSEAVVLVADRCATIASISGWSAVVGAAPVA